MNAPKAGITGSAPKNTTRATTILLLDDDEDQLFVYKTLLESRGFQVITSDTAREALQILSSVFVDLVICDVLMPGMSGEEFIHRARQAHGLGSLPIITFTAGSSDLRSKLIKAGANSFVEKTKASKELIDQISLLVPQQGRNKSLLDQIKQQFK